MHVSTSRPYWQRKLLALVAVLAVPAMLLALSGPAVADNGADYSIAGGWFFTQTGGTGGNGFAVRDAGTDSSGKPIKFWAEFQRLGGVPTLGYPIGQPYVGGDGFTYQPFQRAILQWRPELSQAFLSNTFEQFQSAGRDAWLSQSKGIPLPIANDNSGGDFGKALFTRLGWLTNDSIKEKFYANPNPSAIAGWSSNDSIQLYGLPMSQPEKNGPFISQRFQRISFQLWTEAVAGMPAPGTVVGVLGGDLVKEAGLIPAAAVVALGPGGITITPPTPTPPPPTPAPTFAWRLTRSWGYPNCGTTYIKVFVSDAGGNGVDGVAIKNWNDWGNVYQTSTANGGLWSRVFAPAAGKWYTQVLDSAGNPASEVATSVFTGSCDPNSGSPVQQVELEFRAS